MPNYKKVLLIDLDGVLNEYRGDFDKDFIPPIKSGAKDFIKELAKTYELRLFTTRNNLLASKWLVENKLDEFFTEVTDKKELAWLQIDDRCVNFDGNYEHLLKSIEKFKPWYK
ncbi:hypothetical protein KBA27_04005 [bacterium]|nr:hypothetical protein [bacterium]